MPVAVTLLLASGASADPGQEHAERAVLTERVHELRGRIDRLRSDRDYLLFQKTMYASDSKYLVIDLAANKGQLKYKNRVLKDFSFKLTTHAARQSLRPGMLTLARKAEEKGGRNALVFGNSLIVQWKRKTVPPAEAGLPVLTVTKRDLLSLFFAVEDGAPAYIVR